MATFELFIMTFKKVQEKKLLSSTKFECQTLSVRIDPHLKRRPLNVIAMHFNKVSKQMSQSQMYKRTVFASYVSISVVN